MRYSVKAKVNKETEAGTWLHVFVPDEFLKAKTEKLAIDGILTGELKFDDGRMLSAKQRGTIYLFFKEIGLWMGYRATDDEEVKEKLKYDLLIHRDIKPFSLSSCSVTEAYVFIDYLIEFVIKHGVPTESPLLGRTQDIDRVLYWSLIYKKCAICGQIGETHHAEDHVGMGRNRDEIIHLGMRVMCLCRAHHNECHSIGQHAFNEKWKVYGIKADETICEKLGLNYPDKN